MKLQRGFAFLALAALLCFSSGCALPKIALPELIKPTPTPLPTRAPLPTRPLPSPRPTLTPTPAPRQLGIRNGSAGSVQILNSSGLRFRQFYLQADGGSGWGRNLLPQESSIHVGEMFAFYYPQAAGGIFNLRFVDTQERGFEIHGVPLSDFVSATLRYDAHKGEAYLTYTSLSGLVQTDTRNSTSSQSEDEEDYEEDYEDEDYDEDYEDYEDEDDQDWDEEEWDDWEDEEGWEVFPTDQNGDYDESQEDEQWDVILR